ncbi:hypothetical protein IAT40_001948 [Kwoniella sp. CBS 6097]
MSFPFVACPGQSRSHLNDNTCTKTGPSPNPMPLGGAAYGYKGERDIPVLYADTVPQPILQAIHEALRMALQIIVSPSGIEVAAVILSGSNHPDPRFREAIRLILQKAEYTVVILQEGCVFIPSYHARPAMSDEVAPYMEDVIYIEERWLLILAASLDNAEQNVEGWTRNLFYVGMMFAHELIHCSRRPLALKLEPIGVSVPYNPPRADKWADATGFMEYEGGWDFESALMKYQVEGIWLYDNPGLRAAAEAQVEAIFAAANADGSNLYDLVDMYPEPPGLKEIKGFDLLAIRRNGNHYKITLEWLKDLHDAFYLDGDLSAIPFPPTTEEMPFVSREFRRTARRERDDMAYFFR